MCYKEKIGIRGYSFFWKGAMAFCIFICSAFLLACPVAAQEPGWNIEKSKHFIIYYRDAFPEYIKRTVTEAEGYYDTITDYLGFKRYGFWTWNNRCKIYIYRDMEDYQKNVGAAAWSRGHVNVIKKEISSYVWREKFFDTILPHEMAHIIFREFVDYDKDLPLWLDEGVACSQEKDSGERLLIGGYLIALKLYIPFEDFSVIRIPDLIMPFIFYAQSASMVNYLLEDFGRRSFVNFCRRVRDNANWKGSLLSVYRFKDLQAFEDSWVEYVSRGIIKKEVEDL